LLRTWRRESSSWSERANECSVYAGWWLRCERARNCATLCNNIGSSTRLGETIASVLRIVYVGHYLININWSSRGIIKHKSNPICDSLSILKHVRLFNTDYLYSIQIIYIQNQSDIFNFIRIIGKIYNLKIYNFMLLICLYWEWKIVEYSHLYFEIKNIIYLNSTC